MPKTGDQKADRQGRRRADIAQQLEIDHVGDAAAQHADTDHGYGGQGRDDGNRRKEGRRRHEHQRRRPQAAMGIGKGTDRPLRLLDIGRSQAIAEGGGQTAGHGDPRGAVHPAGIKPDEDGDAAEPQRQADQGFEGQRNAQPYRADHRPPDGGRGIEHRFQRGGDVQGAEGEQQEGKAGIEETQNGVVAKMALQFQRLAMDQRHEQQEQGAQGHTQLDEQHRPQDRRTQAQEQEGAAPDGGEQKQADSAGDGHATGHSGSRHGLSSRFPLRIFAGLFASTPLLESRDSYTRLSLTSILPRVAFE